MGTSSYANSVKTSKNPNSSFNSDYSNDLYNKNYNYNSMKHQNKQNKNTFSSYKNDYNSYNSANRYKSKKYKTKIKYKSNYYLYGGVGFGMYYGYNYYPSYVYNPLYANIYSPFNPYRFYGYYPYYRRPNYYNSYYRNYYQNENNNQQTEFNSVNLPAEYNPSDWVPSYQPYFNREVYINTINKNLNSVKIFSQCCEIFCIVMVKNSNDGIKSNKKRVFFEVVLKNFAFFDPMLIDASKKKCLIENINTKDTSNLATENIFKKCNVESPYLSLPLKQSCVKQMNYHCEKSGFNNLVKTSTSYISSSDATIAKKCEAPQECVNLPDNTEVTEEEKKKCGGKLLNIFSPNLMKPNFGSLISPCEIVVENNKKSSFIELTNTLKSTSNEKYVDMNNKDVLENVNKLSNIANGVVESSNISIDDNTASRANTVTDSDMDLINKDTYTLVQDAIVQSSDSSSDSNYIGNSGAKIGILYSIMVILLAAMF